jgi:hypothetical protein
MSKHDKVTPGPGQDIRKYTDRQLVDRTIDRAAKGQHSAVKQLTEEMARRTTKR